MSGERFGFVQFEFAFPLGPADGRYLRRDGGEPARVIVLRTVGAAQRRLLGGRRPRAVSAEEGAVPVPTTRATLIAPQPLESPERWLDDLRHDAARRDAEVARAAAELSALLRAHRAAAADPWVRELAAANANAIRVGYGSGDEVAEGRFAAAYDVPRRAPSRRRGDVLAPQERLAAILTGREPVRVAEELVLRARTDLAGGHAREAALQTRIALEALLAERPADSGALEKARAAVGEAANAALEGEPSGELQKAVADCVEVMERMLARMARRA